MKALYVTGLAAALLTTQAFAQAVVISPEQRTTIKEYGLPADYWDTYPEKIAAVTAADVQRVAQKYIPLDDIVIVAVGDASKIAPVLNEFGTVEAWDAEGHRQAQ